MYIDGATEIVVNSDLELLKILERGSHKRHVSGTSMNVESSRSHAICMHMWLDSMMTPTPDGWSRSITVWATCDVNRSWTARHSEA